MKRHWKIIILLGLTAIAVLLAVKYWPHTVPEEACSDLYRHYAGQEGIEATFIRQRRLDCGERQSDSTLRVDLTLLQATTETGWQQLTEDFDIPPLTAEEQRLTDDENLEILLTLLPTHAASGNADRASDDEQQLFPTDIAAISRQLHCVSVFHVCDEAQFNAIVDKHIDQLLK